MSGPIAPLDPTTPKIPDELWKASGIPATGWVVRGWVALILIIAGWILADVTGNAYLWALAVVGVAAFFAMPLLVESLVLARLSAKVDAIELERNADKGHAVLEQLRSNTTAKMLAPHGWLRVQEGRVHLAVGDGRAAAKAFAEAERVSTHADKHELASAQAHALVLAGDRKEARELLAQLRKRDQLSDLDHLNFGVVLLSEAGHNQEALGHLQQARAAFGDHPRALAGVVLALQRCDKADEAAALLREAEDAVEASGDAIAQELLKRAKKGLRPLLEAKRKRERKSEKRVEPTETASPEAQRKPKGKKGRKQSRRDARKKAKTEARHGEGGPIAASDEALVEREHDESAEHDDATEAEAPVEQAPVEQAPVEQAPVEQAKTDVEAPAVAVEDEESPEPSEPAPTIAEPEIERASEPEIERASEPEIERASEPEIERASEPEIERASEPVIE
ncbi:MAG TPA: hypothetical protein VM869_24680, partial [Enhygromyxa sp.]|nr:hypothetical protein [Enhygromyxa sp.]